MVLQPIINIAEICARKKVRNVILSPGSRCAPLTLAFVRHPDIDTKIISDERAAGFIALGMALTLREPVALICTSGTAAYNYAPAIAEAFFQQVPLIVFTADRPMEWIGQQDGQTIFQKEIYGKHVKASYNLPEDYNHKDVKWYIERTVSEAINLSNTGVAGPVHINVPLREPFYPASDEKFVYEKNVKIIDTVEGERTLTDADLAELVEVWNTNPKKLIIAGQHPFDKKTFDLLNTFSNTLKIPVVADIISNFQDLEYSITEQDIFLGKKDEKLFEELKPDLIITFGNSVISKNLKVFVRNHKSQIHWHIQADGVVADAFQTLTRIIRTSPATFFASLTEKIKTKDVSTGFLERWGSENNKAKKFRESFFPKPAFSEFEAADILFKYLPPQLLLHLANSMSVRYAQYIGLPKNKAIEVFANRGTSGIDGCSSTAVGAALSTDKQVLLLSGDMAFLYDRNAFWHNYLPKNLRIVVMNNYGGGIFGLIDGPGNLPELEEYFETKHFLDASHVADEFGFEYLKATNPNDLKKALEHFFDLSDRPKILEIPTERKINRQIFTEFKTLINKNYEI